MSGDPDPSGVGDGDVVLAEATRSGLVENVHRGHAVIVDAAGAVLASWGNPAAVILPRSANKPAQATAMKRAGLPLDGPPLALAAASHGGEAIHLDGVRQILALAGLDVGALQTPPDLPSGPAARDAWLAAGRGPERIAMTCSGKHAAMLLTCATRGWDVATYREPSHPLQLAIRAEIEVLAGERPGHVAVDGCGAPLFSLTLRGLARVAARMVGGDPGTPQRAVADAMRAHPEYVGGSESPTTRLMAGVPGLLGKDGADGVWIAALPEGVGIAVKVTDGADRPRVPIIVALLRRLGRGDAVLDEFAEGVVLGGGRPVGVVRARL